MAQMSQEKWEQKLGFELKAIISKLLGPRYVRTGDMHDKGKTVDDFKVDHDSDKMQVYELRVRNYKYIVYS